MKRAALVAPVRTAVGRFGGALRDVPAESLAATVVKETVRRSGIDPSRIDDVAMGQSYANSEAPCIGRWAALEAGLPISVAGFQTDRRCGTGLQAIVSAAMMVQTGAADVVLAGGVESMSGIEHYTTGARWGTRSGGLQLFDRLDRGRERSQPEWRFGRISGMIETAENVATRCGITREESDTFAVDSHRKATLARESGRFDAEIVAVELTDRKGNVTQFRADEGIRPDTSLETLARLRAVTEGGVVKEWGFEDLDRLNVNGSGISLGHPVGATGARMATTALHELGRRGGGKALLTMCIGGGQGMAAVVESA